MKPRAITFAVVILGLSAVVFWMSGNSTVEFPAGMSRGVARDLSDPRWKWDDEMRAKDRSYEWRMRIEFYGKVVDENGTPVADAVADLVWNDLSAKGTSQRRIKSDRSGLFSITGIRGKGMSVRVGKEGYDTSKAKNRVSFEYAGFWEPTFHEPDPKNPVVFYLRKRGVPEPLLHHGPTLFAAPNDGSPAVFDLRTGRKWRTGLGVGEIQVRMTTGPKVDRRFDWTATIEAVGGAGLIQSNAEFMVIAPKDGYQNALVVSQKATDVDYDSETQVKFFVRTADGKYCRVEMRIVPKYQDQGAVLLTTFFNPSGSTNLEFHEPE